MNLCRAYRLSGRDREALAPALGAPELRFDPDGYALLGGAALNLNAFDAIDERSNSMQRAPTQIARDCNLGWLCDLTGRHVEAIAASETAIVCGRTLPWRT